MSIYFLEYSGMLAKADILQVISFLVNIQGIILSCRNIMPCQHYDPTRWPIRPWKFQSVFNCIASLTKKIGSVNVVNVNWEENNVADSLAKHDLVRKSYWHGCNLFLSLYGYFLYGSFWVIIQLFNFHKKRRLLIRQLLSLNLAYVKKANCS
jgi:hypothetical protein